MFVLVKTQEKDSGSTAKIVTGVVSGITGVVILTVIFIVIYKKYVSIQSFFPKSFSVLGYLYVLTI